MCVKCALSLSPTLTLSALWNLKSELRAPAPLTAAQLGPQQQPQQSNWNFSFVLIIDSCGRRTRAERSSNSRSIFVAYFSVGSACVLCCCCGGTARATAAAAVAATRTAQHPLHLQISSVGSSSSAAATVATATSKNSLSEFQKRKKQEIIK